MAAALIWLILAGDVLVPHRRRAKAYKVPFRACSLLSRFASGAVEKESYAVLPSLEAVCTGCWLVKIVEPAIVPTRNAPAKISIIWPTGCGGGWNRLICRSKSFLVAVVHMHLEPASLPCEFTSRRSVPSFRGGISEK
jgi:hypothetical protein